MRVFKVSGEFYITTKIGKERCTFTKEVIAEDENKAVEYVYSLIGSNHKVKRRFIRIREVKEVKNPDEIENPRIKEVVLSKEI